MPLGYATVAIAGVSLEDAAGVPCKVLVLDGANLLSTVTGSAEVAADGTVYIQTLTPVGGRAFGLRAEFLPPDVLNDIVAAVLAAVEAGTGFSIVAEDDIHNISVTALPDFSQQWLQYPEQRTDPETVRDVVFRFITAE